MLKELTIYKHSAMIQTNVKNLTLTQRKIINFFIYIVQKKGLKELHNTDIKTLKKLCNIKSTENIDIKKQLNDLSEIFIEFNYLNKDKYDIWEKMCLISYIKIDFGTGKINFEMPFGLQRKILNPNIYAPIKVLMLASLKNKYSIILYELLRDYKNSPYGMPKLTIKEFRNLLGIDKNKYKAFKDFRKYVLDIAVKEVNKKTDLKCKYKLFKEHGNKYSYIQFYVEENKIIKEKFDLNLLNNSNENVKNKDQLTKQLDETELKISKEFSISDNLILEWTDKFGKEKINEIYEYTKSMKPKKPAGYMRRIIETGVNLDNISVISKEEKARKLKIEADNCMMKCVVEEIYCGKHIEDVQDPKDKCYYCVFKDNESLERMQKTEEKLEKEKNTQEFKDCIKMLKETEQIKEYATRIKENENYNRSLKLFRKNPLTQINMLNSLIYKEWKKDQINN